LGNDSAGLAVDDDLETIEETQLDGFVSGLLVTPETEFVPSTKEFADGSAKRDLSIAFEDIGVQ
ncbi:hypothetical protein A2U01_0076766, partial [Trifolium medium]|nr:hypothetical protein [Trifolium medium]